MASRMRRTIAAGAGYGVSRRRGTKTACSEVDRAVGTSTSIRSWSPPVSGGSVRLRSRTALGVRPSSADTSEPASDEPGDLVDEQEDVTVLLVAEILGHGQAGQADPLARTGRLVHLAEHERGLGDDARLGHLGDQVVALAAALADAGEHRHAGVLLGDVADQLLDDDRLADAGPTEDPDLAALLERADEVDDLEPGLEHLDLGRLLVDAAGWSGSAGTPCAPTGPFSSIRMTEHVEDAAEVASPTGTEIGSPYR